MVTTKKKPVPTIKKEKSLSTNLSNDFLISTIHDHHINPKKNHIFLFSGNELHEENGIWGPIASKFILNLHCCMMMNPGKPILVHMKIGGGDWDEGMGMYDAIRSCPVPVTILNYSSASSMSSILFLSGDKRIMMPNSHFMFHQGEANFYGTIKQLNSQHHYYGETMSDVMINIYSEAMQKKGEFAGRDRKVINNWLRSQMDKREDVYLNAEQTVQYGFADGIFGQNKINWDNLIGQKKL
jgi:ATP-dependent protease ClpP protease subunit